MAENADCKKCVVRYWACDCGASPMNQNRPNDPPKKCCNVYCVLQKFTWKEFKRCCRHFNHHLGTTCKHCGQVG